MGGLVFSFNGVISTIVLDHISPFRLAQVRSIGAFFILLVIALIIDRESLRTPKQLIPKLAAYGIIGFAAVQAGYFLGIQRGVPLSLVLIIEFTAPIWIALCRSALSLTVGGLGMATRAWSSSMPVWQFPFEVFSIDMDLQGVFAGNTLPGWVLILWIILMGTIVPYLFVISGLRLLSASTSSVIGMMEPVFAGIFAWIWLEQSWNGIQLIGAVVVLVGIYIADRARSVAG